MLGAPYDILLQVFYEEDEQKTIDLVQQYLKQWYPAMKDHPRWYDEHLKINKQGHAGYYGYWAFEAAAAVYLLDLDDGQIQDMTLAKRDRMTTLDLIASNKWGNVTSVPSLTFPPSVRWPAHERYVINR